MESLVFVFVRETSHAASLHLRFHVQEAPISSSILPKAPSRRPQRGVTRIVALVTWPGFCLFLRIVVRGHTYIQIMTHEALHRHSVPWKLIRRPLKTELNLPASFLLISLAASASQSGSLLKRLLWKLTCHLEIRFVLFLASPLQPGSLQKSNSLHLLRISMHSSPEPSLRKPVVDRSAFYFRHRAVSETCIQRLLSWAKLRTCMGVSYVVLTRRLSETSIDFLPIETWLFVPA